MYEFVDFAGVERRTVTGRIQDFGSMRVQLRVRDLDAAIFPSTPVGGPFILPIVAAT
jgi:hypothetical protein